MRQRHRSNHGRMRWFVISEPAQLGDGERGNRHQSGPFRKIIVAELAAQIARCIR